MESSLGHRKSSFILFRAGFTCMGCVRTWQLMQSSFVTAVLEHQVSKSTSLCCENYRKVCACLAARKRSSAHGETGVSWQFLENDCEIEYGSD
jgi:hypothetical protein